MPRRGAARKGRVGARGAAEPACNRRAHRKNGRDAAGGATILDRLHAGAGTRRRRLAAAMALCAAALAGWGGGGEPPPPEDPCAAPDPEPGDVAGAFVGRRGPGPRYLIESATGRAYSTGRLAEIAVLGEEVTLIRDDETGGYQGFARERLAPIPALASDAPAEAFDATLPAEGDVMLRGQVVLGPRTPPSQVPSAGSRRYEGAAAVEVLRPGDGAGPIAYVGKAAVDVQFGGGAVTLTLSELKAAKPDAAPDMAEIAWTGLKVCGGRLVSTGAGRLGFRDGAGAAVDVVGPPGGGQARLRATLYGQGEDGFPAAAGGAFLVTGDAGAASGVFAAGEPKPKPAPEPTPTSEPAPEKR